MRKFYFILFLILAHSSFIKGQSDYYNLNGNSNFTIEPFTQKQAKVSTVNHFLNEEWQGGLIKLKNEHMVNGYLYRYNIFTDQIELKSVIEPNSVDVISIGVQKFIYSDFIVGENSINSGYFELILNGDCRLLIRRYIRANEQDYRVSKILGTTSAAPASSVIKEYYIKKGDEPAVLVDKNKDSILEYLSDKDDFQKYLKKKFIVFLNENKLKEIIDYYNKI